jgi:hypothetical protein
MRFAERKERFVLVKVFRLEQKVCRQSTIPSLGKKQKNKNKQRLPNWNVLSAAVSGACKTTQERVGVTVQPIGSQRLCSQAGNVSRETLFTASCILRGISIVVFWVVTPCGKVK